MSYSNIRFQAENDGVALVSVNRPDKLNALNRETMGELADAFSRVRDDAAIRGLIVMGAGEKAFVAGADIKELAVLSPVEAQALSQRGQAIFRTLETMHAEAFCGGDQRIRVGRRPGAGDELYHPRSGSWREVRTA